MNTEQENTLRDIRALIARSKNGIVAEKIRTSGLNYKLTLGVDWVRLSEIAAGFGPDRALAHELWLSPVREHKLIATLLCPRTDMSDAELGFWTAGIANYELAEIAAFALLSRIPSLAGRLVEMVSDDRELIRLTAILAVGRMHNFMNTMPEELLDRARQAIRPDDRSNRKFYHALESLQ